MKEIIKTISLDLWRKSNTRLVFAKQDDRKSRKVKVELTAAGEPYRVSADTVAAVNVRRPDGSSKAFAAEVTDDGCVMVTLSLWMLSCAGNVDCCISLFDADSNKLSSANFTLEVDEALYLESTISSDPNYSLLTDMMSRISAYTEAEAARVTAEKERETSESVRVEAEEHRAISEEHRAISEAGRQQAEALRERAETVRATAENQRVEAENIREKRMTAFDAELQRLDGRMAYAERNIASLNNRTSSAEGNIASLNNRTSSAEGNIASLHNRMNSAEGNIASLNNRTSSAEGNIASLNNRMSSAEEDIGSLYGKGGLITLSPTDFNSNLVFNASIEGLGENDAVFFSPVEKKDVKMMSRCKLFASALKGQGMVSFSVTLLPTEDIALNYFICRGGMS